MLLTPHFTLEEMTKSDLASRYIIDNSPKDSMIIESLRQVCVRILEPVRTYFNKPVVVTSGYRCLELNSKAGGQPNSQHLKGQAADYSIPGLSNYDLANWVVNNLHFDQCILEFHIAGEPESGWVHTSWNTESSNRSDVLTINKQGKFKGLLK
jgi:hypothetical protein